MPQPFNSISRHNEDDILHRFINNDNSTDEVSHEQVLGWQDIVGDVVQLAEELKNSFGANSTSSEAIKTLENFFSQIDELRIRFKGLKFSASRNEESGSPCKERKSSPEPTLSPSKDEAPVAPELSHTNVIQQDGGEIPYNSFDTSLVDVPNNSPVETSDRNSDMTTNRASRKKGMTSRESQSIVTQIYLYKIRELLAKKETEQTEVSGSDLVHDGKSAELDFEKTPKRKMQDDGYGTPDENLVTKPDQEESISIEDALSYLLQQNESGGPADSSDSAGAISAEGTQVAEEVSSNPGQVGKPVSIDDCIVAALRKDYQQKAVASLTVGRKGDEIELFGFKVIIPSEAVKMETKFRMSVDNNPENYPENEDALAPILGVSHHLKFDRPVTVKIRTYLSAARGGTIHAHILRRECKAGSAWKHYKNVLISDQNDVEFEVEHFSKFFLGLRKKPSSKPVLHYFKDVYIQRGIGLILIMHLQDEKSAKKKQEEVEKQDYQRATPVALPSKSIVDSEKSGFVLENYIKPLGATTCEGCEGNAITKESLDFLAFRNMQCMFNVIVEMSNNETFHFPH